MEEAEQEKVRLFLAPPFKANKEMVRIVRTFNAAHLSGELLFKNLPKDYSFKNFTFTDDITASDFVLVPQSIKRVTERWETYFKTVQKMAHQHDKQILIFIGGDMAYKTHVAHAICFKSSEFKSRKHENEILVPGYSEDLSEVTPFKIRTKKEKPTVSFCGYAGFPDMKTRVKYVVMNLALNFLALVSGRQQLRVYKRGIYFRRAGLRALKKNVRIETSFIIRSSFSGNAKSVSLDPVQARREYIDNMDDSDFVFAPKGDGNYSIRFYEALSLGRIPVLIDTDMELPLEHIIDYSKFILRVPHAEISHVGDIIADFYDSISDEKFQDMQKQARAAFTEHLRYDKFFDIALPLLKKEGTTGFSSHTNLAL